jgi:uncharacterized protein with PIN domain
LTTAYVDTSVLVATLLGERSAAELRRRFGRFELLVSSPLLEAEVFAVFAREGLDVSAATTENVELVQVNRSLTAELYRVYAAGHVRGADAWHLATALYLSPDPSQLTFVTLDAAQGKVAESLGFAV